MLREKHGLEMYKAMLMTSTPSMSAALGTDTLRPGSVIQFLKDVVALSKKCELKQVVYPDAVASLSTGLMLCLYLLVCCSYAGATPDPNCWCYSVGLTSIGLTLC